LAARIHFRHCVSAEFPRRHHSTLHLESASLALPTKQNRKYRKKRKRKRKDRERKMADLSRQSRHLYRALLRELPRRPLSSPSPLKLRFRERFQSPPKEISSSPLQHQQELERADQFVRYARAQRMYATLVERYNPGMDMDQEERVRLSARRVGMNLPIEVESNNNNNEGGEGRS
jgi:hypothetical protein